MDGHMIAELIGYIGSALVLISFLMASVIKLRIINTIGSLISVIYSLIISAYPTALMNAALVCINIYYLIQYMRLDRNYTVVKTTINESSITYFLGQINSDLLTYFPSFDQDLKQADCMLSVFLKNEIVGFFAGKTDGKTMDILVDYTTPAYRDTSVGRQLYLYLKAQGYHELVYQGNNAKHIHYLLGMGFTHCDDGYVKVL